MTALAPVPTSTPAPKAEKSPTTPLDSLDGRRPHLARTSSIEESSCALRLVANRIRFSHSNDGTRRSFPHLGRPSQERLDASLTEQPLDIERFGQDEARAAEQKGKTILYLAYGSNLCNETFRGKRGIQPLSKINAQVPELRLTFDLPGIPYNEPCFANSATRDPEDDNGKDGKDKYHKDRWHKGLIGVVYEVTPSDYAHIIATEGGGATYNDILVTCYPLPDGETVPESPSTPPFKAHTLFAPAATPETKYRQLKTTDRFSRPDPSYAQPSARYLKLITDGAAELSLPSEYQTYLHNIRPYTITTTKQKMGQAVITSTFVPFAFMIFALQQKFQDDKGRMPKWLANLMGALFLGLWTSYDNVLVKMFGDGERTEGQDEDADNVPVVKEKGWLGRSREEGGYQKV